MERCLLGVPVFVAACRPGAGDEKVPALPRSGGKVFPLCLELPIAMIGDADFGNRCQIPDAIERPGTI